MPVYFNRDLSWTGFNGRVLDEAAKMSVPLMERIRFLAIFSSNLDEFYRVRMPVVMALHSAGKGNPADQTSVLSQINTQIAKQQRRFGTILTNDIIPGLAGIGVDFHYQSPVPGAIMPALTEIFNKEILGLLRVSRLEPGDRLPAAENNRIYQLAIAADADGHETLFLIYIPADRAGRFFKVNDGARQHVVFIEDIVCLHLAELLVGFVVQATYNLKVTRNADLHIEEEYGEALPEILEARLQQRELGTATRLLYQPGLKMRHLYAVVLALGLEQAMLVEGGRYHNLKDLADLPAGKAPGYMPWPPVPVTRLNGHDRIFTAIEAGDIFVHTPYQDYSPVLRFFNEAATDPGVAEIWVTLYRVATDSRIAQSLVTAAYNGKQVTVLVELKARFDEANNIKWAKTMKAAGVSILYSRFDQKVHAKVALVKRTAANGVDYLGLMATGNLNEQTARFYTDHILLTANQALLAELRDLFAMLRTRGQGPQPVFRGLLVAGFNLQQRFLELIDEEIVQAKGGNKAQITLKMNNLEEQVLISKLYEAAAAGVQIRLLVRSICCLIPGVEGLSENISVKRLVGRYLEHGRVFIFGSGPREQIFLGSADWMNRNIYNRIEVCFPLQDDALRKEIKEMIRLQLADNLQAVALNGRLENEPVPAMGAPLDAQEAIYNLLRRQAGLAEQKSLL